MQVFDIHQIAERAGVLPGHTDEGPTVARFFDVFLRMQVAATHSELGYVDAYLGTLFAATHATAQILAGKLHDYLPGLHFIVTQQPEEVVQTLVRRAAVDARLGLVTSCRLSPSGCASGRIVDDATRDADHVDIYRW